MSVSRIRERSSGKGKGVKRSDAEAFAKLYSESDNPGEASWRNNEPPVANIRIPEWLVYQETAADQRPIHEVIARNHHTFIFSEHSTGKEGCRTFGLWGSKENVLQAEAAFRTWIAKSASDRPKQGLQMIKLVSLTPALREKFEKRWRREVRRHQFRQVPPAAMPFTAVGNFHWPNSYPSPGELLGVNHEVLDPIRMACHCYIVFFQEHGRFQVMSQGKLSNVQKCLQRLRYTCFQIAARNIEPVRQYLLHSNAAGSSAPRISLLSVRLKKYTRQLAQAGVACMDEPQNFYPYLQQVQTPSSVSEDRFQPSQKTYKKMSASIETMLQRLHYYRGHVKLRVRLGIFVATQYKPPSNSGWSMLEFETMIKASQFAGRVTQEIAVPENKQLLTAVYRANDWITSPDAVTTDVRDIKPSFEADFDFEEMDGGALRLQIVWKPVTDEYTGETSYDRASEKWTRLESGREAPAELLDLNVIDLGTPSAWHFGLSVCNGVNKSRLTPELLAFAESVELNPQSSSRDCWDMVKYRLRARPYALKSLAQRRVFHFALAHSDYILELAQFQIRTFKTRNSPGSEPRWSVNVLRGQWDTLFAQNEQLVVGKCVDWQAEKPSWFPADHAKDDDDDRLRGFMDFMTKLKRVEKVLGLGPATAVS